MTHRFAAAVLAALLAASGASGQSAEEVRRQMRPPSGIEEEPPAWWANWPTWSLYAGVVLLAAAAGAALAYRALGRRVRAARPPDEVALAAITRLQRAAGTADGGGERLVAELSDVVRAYVEQRFRLPATTATTPEFLDSLRGLTLFGDEDKEALTDFLGQCDLVKFAGVGVTQEQVAGLCGSACEFVRRTASAIDRGAGGH